MTGKIRFGATLAPSVSAKKWRERVTALEDSPFDVLLVNDHLSGLRYAPMVALAAAAQLTDRIRLGVLVLANDYRHPAVLAKEAATLDLLSGGRLELGMGAGWMRSDYDSAGIAFDSPRVRLARLREGVQIVREAWKAGPFDFTGEFYTATGLDHAPLPLQDGGPPLLLGGGGPQMLRFAAREGDIVNVTTRTASNGRGVAPDDVGLEPLLRKLELVHDAAKEADREVEISVGIRAVAIDDRLSEVHPTLGNHVDAMRPTPFIMEGSVESVAEKILLWHELHNVSYFVLANDSDVEKMIPVVQRVKEQNR